MPPWIKSHKNGSTLSLYIQPGASRSEVCGIHDGKLKIKIKAPPRDGEANEAIIEFLSVILKISKKQIHLISGETSRQKVVLVELAPDKVLTLLSL
jgi:uncharacterized protein (TIGR00251 family)